MCVSHLTKRVFLTLLMHCNSLVLNLASAPYRPTAVQMANLALAEAKRITVWLIQLQTRNVFCIVFLPFKKNIIKIFFLFFAQLQLSFLWKSGHI